MCLSKAKPHQRPRCVSCGELPAHDVNLFRLVKCNFCKGEVETPYVILTIKGEAALSKYGLCGRYFTTTMTTLGKTELMKIG